MSPRDRGVAVDGADPSGSSSHLPYFAGEATQMSAFKPKVL
jgi:hypothetical protein